MHPVTVKDAFLNLLLGRKEPYFGQLWDEVSLISLLCNGHLNSEFVSVKTPVYNFRFQFLLTNYSCIVKT